MDAFECLGFCKFFKELYGNKTSLIQGLKNELNEHLTDILDREISIQELTDCIQSCKRGKAFSEDLISNEFLKGSSSEMLRLMTLLFNKCLEFGVYPWSTSLVTPFHKKGDIYNPNKYRAIAVARNLGKLFSSILLQ